MKIKSITEKQNHRGSWWLITTDEPGRRGLATSSMFDAGLAQRALETGAEVKIQTRTGWHYDDVTYLALADAPADRSR